MNFNTTLSFIAAILSIALAVFVLLRDRHSFVHRIFTVGIMTFALEAGLTGLSFQTTAASGLLYLQRLKLIVGSFLPGIWLIFSLSFARPNYREFLSKWKWILLASFVLPLLMITLFGGSFFVGGPVIKKPVMVFFRLGWSGLAYCLFSLLGAVLILMNLERTLRHSTGYMRWQVKFLIIGIGGLFGIRLYFGSQAMLFRSLDTGWEMLNVGALIVADAMVFWSLLRMRVFNIDFYLSHSFLYSSFTILLVGIYFVAVGLVAKIAVYFKDGRNLPLTAFLVFIAVVGLAVLLFSDPLRLKRKRFISRHFKRPRYDYREMWAAFTQWTTSVTEPKDLCAAVAKMVSKTFEILSVTIWLLDEKEERLTLGGSTIFSEVQAKGIKSSEKGERELIHAIRSQSMPIDFDSGKGDWASDLKAANSDYFREARIRYCVPLVAGEKLLGIMTLSDRIAGVPFTTEDFDLLKTVVDQAAASLLNLKLSERLRQLGEVEAYRNMSAFLMHDLKNLASSLSLTMENLPIHFDNPDFRNDALKIVQQSVTRVNSLCSHLATLSQKIETKKVEVDLNELIASSLSCLNGINKVSILKDLQPVPSLMIDPEQVQKVLNNLFLNAHEALANGGEIRVATEQSDGWAIVSIQDNGCGITKEFIEQSLFRPFKTTKKQGMGIGLFQSKMIVEAHQGKIEVESEEGRGSTFRIILPILKE
jgi:putative PEP-CTERM system histidine kinase